MSKVHTRVRKKLEKAELSLQLWLIGWVLWFQPFLFVCPSNCPWVFSNVALGQCSIYEIWMSQQPFVHSRWFFRWYVTVMLLLPVPCVSNLTQACPTLPNSSILDKSLYPHYYPHNLHCHQNTHMREKEVDKKCNIFNINIIWY